MHLRKLVLACGFASFALSNYASALGLGEIKLKSTLNQPLSAEVQLLDTKGLSSEQIIVALASAVDFDRNGLDYVHFYSELKFDVALDNPSGPVVRITSRNPVREPYLNFLVEAKWTSGRLLREYTLLMDLPTFDDAKPKTVESAQTSQSKPAAATTTTRRTETTTTAPVLAAPASVDTTANEEKPTIIAEQDQTRKKSKVASGTYGPVGAKDTLWDIASSVRPDSSTSVHQTMMALQRLNPDAFIHGNINLLKKGQVLRVPDAAEMSSISQSEAVRQFNSQSADWSSGASAANTGLGAQLDASRRTASEQPKSEAVAGRVKLEAPGAKDRAANGQGSGANKGSGKALESELATTLEELDKAKSDKTELSSRVRDLEEQVKTMQRLVDVSNEKLRALQLNSAKQPEAAAAQKPGGVATATQASVVSSAVQASSQSVASSAVAVAPVVAAGQASNSQSETSSSSAAVAPVKKPVVKPVPKAEPEKSIVDVITDNILYVGIGAAAILAAIAFAVIRRRKAEDDSKDDSDTDGFVSDDSNFESFNQPHSEESGIDAPADEITLSDEASATTVAETGDVVGEADIYIAYGKYDQAEEMLLNGLAKDPTSVDIRLKLMEIYSQTKNLSQFDKHYAAILPFAAGFALSRASELRSAIPDASEFVADTSVSEPELAEDFELDEDELFAKSLAEETPHEDDLSFELDLDDESDISSELSDTASKYESNAISDEADFASLDDDFTLDFDLDEPATGHHHPEAEDLTDISLALDALDDDKLPDDIETSPRVETSSTNDFNYDFDDLEDEPTASLFDETNSASSELDETESESTGDDFNLDMDVNSVDLAALDNEMAGLDAELDMLDESDSGKSNLTTENFNTDNLSGESLADLDDSLDTDLDDLFDSKLDGELDTELDGELDNVNLDSTEIDDAELDESEFSWDEPELESESHTLFTPNNELAEKSVEESAGFTNVDDSLDTENLSEADDFSESDDPLEIDEIAESSDLNPDDVIENELLIEQGLFVEEDDDDSEIESSVDLADDNFSVESNDLDSDLELDSEPTDFAALESDELDDLDAEFNSNTVAEFEDDFDSELLNDEPRNVEEQQALNDLDSFESELVTNDLTEQNFVSEEQVTSPVSNDSANTIEETSLAGTTVDDDLFEQALSDFSAESFAMDGANMSDEDMDAELDFMADADEAATKLDLARAYMDMGDSEGARDILSEVASEGNEQQRQEAVDLLNRIDA